MAHTKEILLKDFFLEYTKFFIVENQIALIDGRNYYIIYAFFDTLSYIESKNVNLDTCKQKLSKLKESIQVFLTCSVTKYPYIKESSDIYNSIDKIDFKDIIKLFNNSTGNMFDPFYQTYSMVSDYKESEIIEELLIEFNNFLSHFTKYIVNSNLSSGVSHLYRGCLDGYKDIILENNIILLSDIDMRDKFIILRIKECNNIGIKEEDKLFLLKEYKEIAEEIITLYQCYE